MALRLPSSKNEGHFFTPTGGGSVVFLKNLIGAETGAFGGLVFLAEAGTFVGLVLLGAEAKPLVGLVFLEVEIIASVALGTEAEAFVGLIFLGADDKTSEVFVFLGTETGAFEDLGRIWFFFGTEALNVVVDVVTLMVFVAVLTVVETSWPLLRWKVINYYLPQQLFV